LKKTLLVGLSLLCQSTFASDAITIDSIFKSNKGLRSITTLEFLASGGSQTYTTYPALISVDDGNVLVDSKTLSINETLLYAYNSKVDFMLSANASYQSMQYFSNSGFSNKDDTDFNSLWLGVNYQFNSIFGEFKPALNFQVPVFEKYRYQDNSESSSLQAFSTKFSLKNYSDPLVSTFYISALKNFEKLDGDFILSLDPNNGKRMMTKNEFYSVWNKDDNGHILVVLPNDKTMLKDIEFLDSSLLLIK